jgi:hypothetical protein
VAAGTACANNTSLSTRAATTSPSTDTLIRVSSVARSLPLSASASASFRASRLAEQKKPTLSPGALLIASTGASAPTRCAAQSSVPSPPTVTTRSTPRSNAASAR